jgi:hypothetical protein
METNFYQSIFTQENILFSGIMVSLFFISLFRIIKNPKQSTTIPNLLAALGIIGTFMGIFFGLLKFDTAKIDESIPSLLDGMKTAFLTSLLGLVLSNILKCLQSNFLKRQDKKDNNNLQNEISLERVISLMFESNKIAADNTQNIVDALREMSEKNQENMNRLFNLNQEISNKIETGNEILTNEFKIFAKNMAENNMKAFTQAIQDCIKDLNNQLQDQFGENFKHLNSAVEKLLDWQIHYKDTVELTTKNQQKLNHGIQIIKDSIVEIAEKSNTVIEVANKLGDKIITLDTQQEILNRGLNILNNASQKMELLAPNMETCVTKIYDMTKNVTENIEVQQKDFLRNLTEFTTKLQNVSNKNIELIGNQIETLDKTRLKFENVGELAQKGESLIEVLVNLKKNILVLDKQQEKLMTGLEVLNTITKEAKTSIPTLNNYIKEVQSLTKTSTESIRAQQTKIVEALNEFTNKIQNTSTLNITSLENQMAALEKAKVKFENEGFTLTKKISDNIQVMVENNNSNLQTSVQNINDSLSITLNSSLQSLGEQLAAVSEKFVNDYTPLTKELQRLINIAKKIER